MLEFATDRELDAICLGRAGVDLYAAEHNTDFNEVTTLRKHVGGSPANIAVAMARLDCKVGFIGKVSTDMAGRFVRHYLESESIDVTGLSDDDSGSRTSLALTEIKPQDCEVLIYRNNASDLLLSPADIDEAYVRNAGMLVVSGTALCTEPSRSAAMQAIEYAHANEVRVALDLDYRAYTWQSLQEACEVYQQAGKVAGIIFGNLEEFQVMGAAQDATAQEIAQSCFADSATEIVCVKGGAAGSTVFTRDGEVITQPAFTVDALKPFGAGDAYAGAICSGLLQGQPLATCVRNGAASAAIVVSRASCSDASPSLDEIKQFIAEQ